jgi:hypothetical protein
MTVIRYRWVLLLACLCNVALLVTAWLLGRRSGAQRAREAGAWSAVVDYGRCRDAALRSEPEQAVDQLYLIACLPPRRRDDLSPLIRMVERERERDIRDVITYLRSKTGIDLGDEPGKWIEKYSTQANR